MRIRIALAALLALLAVAPAAAQLPNIQDQAVWGRIGSPSADGGSGPSQAIPFASLQAQISAALTSTNDTNVTVTLGGTPASAVLKATSIVMGWTGQLAVSRGGTGLGTITAHCVMLGEGTSNVGCLNGSGGNSSLPLISQGSGSDPIYTTLGLSSLNAGTQDTAIGYWGSTSASAVAVPNCTGAITYNTSTHAWGCNAGVGTGTVTSVVCGTGLSGGTITNTGTCALKMDSATLQASPSNPVGTTSATGVMMGLGATCHLTPTYSSRVKVEFIGSGFNTTASDGYTIKVYFGTSTAPTNGAATTGTQVGNGTGGTQPAGSGGFANPFSNSGIITGLTPGTAYWFDLNVLAVTGGTAAVSGLSCNALEVM